MARPAQVLYGVNVTRARHPKKEVEDALTQLEEAKWTITATSSGHRWGVARCSESNRAGCQVSIWSTPRNPGSHARQLLQKLDRCSHLWTRKDR